MTAQGPSGRERWAAAFAEAQAKGQVRDADFTTISGVEVDPVYGPEDEDADERMERIGWPGEFPFTRGLYPSGYRGRPWTIRQFAGFGNAQQTNERYKMILEAGGGGLSVAFDMPTLMGRDSDDNRSLGEVGHCGVAVDSAADMDLLFSGIDLGAVTTSMTISGPAVPIFCMYLVAAERQGVDLATLNGTLQTDIFKEYIAQKEWLFPPGPHLRLIGDMMEYCSREIPAYKPLSVSGYHIREAGSTAAEELAFTLADGFGYVELGLSRALDIELFAPGLSFFFDAHIDFFEEIAKFGPHAGSGLDGCAIGTARRRSGHSRCDSTPRPQEFRLLPSSPTTTSSEPPSRRWPLSWAEPIRCTRTRWMRRWRCLPRNRRRSRCAPSRSWLRRPGWSMWPIRSVDPGTSRPLPTRSKLKSAAVLDRIEELGGGAARQHEIGPITSGILLGIEEGWFTAQIADSAFRYQAQLEKGDKKIVGVNVHTATITKPLEILRVSHEVEVQQCETLRIRRTSRDGAAVDAALAEMIKVARTDGNMIEPMLAAARAEATLGEICNALRAEWGEYVEPARF